MVGKSKVFLKSTVMRNLKKIIITYEYYRKCIRIANNNYCACNMFVLLHRIGREHRNAIISISPKTSPETSASKRNCKLRNVQVNRRRKITNRPNQVLFDNQKQTKKYL